MDVYVIGYACHPPAEKVLTKRLEEMVYDTSAHLAEIAVFLASPAASKMTGQALSVTGGISAL
jgi:NAD(P)-dependent dehydrogenase (short-subunit alcohol dehydrogenase family)